MNAFILRIAPSRIDRVAEALAEDDLIIGWAYAVGLLEPELDYAAFRQIIHDTYHPHEDTYLRSGSAAGNVWRFVREMNVGDLVVVPHGGAFFVAEVAGPARHEPDEMEADAAYRRDARWLNGKQPIPRKYARAALQSRMKIRQTCAGASDLIADIRDVLNAAQGEGAPTFATDLRQRLVDETLDELHSGRLDSFGFEHLVESVLVSMGGTEVRVVPRLHDKGADVTATFPVAGTFGVRLATQAKHYQPEPPVGPHVVDQLVAGMEAEGATLGWVVTSGTFSEEAESRRDAVEETTGLRIELVDGEQFASMLVEGGLRAIVSGE